MQIAIYARVSSLRQQQHQNIDQQLDRLAAYITQFLIGCSRRITSFATTAIVALNCIARDWIACVIALHRQPFRCSLLRHPIGSLATTSIRCF